jgi:hypothetical protein
MRQVDAKPYRSRARGAAHRVTRSRGRCCGHCHARISPARGNEHTAERQEISRAKSQASAYVNYSCTYGKQNRSAARPGLLATGGRNSSSAGAGDGYRVGGRRDSSIMAIPYVKR